MCLIWPLGSAPDVLIKAVARMYNIVHVWHVPMKFQKEPNKEPGHPSQDSGFRVQESGARCDSSTSRPQVPGTAFQAQGQSRSEPCTSCGSNEHSIWQQTQQQGVSCVFCVCPRRLSNTCVHDIRVYTDMFLKLLLGFPPTQNEIGFHWKPSGTKVSGNICFACCFMSCSLLKHFL